MISPQKATLMKLLNSTAKALLASSICLSFTQVYADTKTSADYAKCMDSVNLGAFKNSQWTNCAAQEIKRQDVTLNAAYNKLMKSVSVNEKKALVKAQKSWLKFREDWCRLEEITATAPGGDTNYNFCIIAVTNKQIDAIQGLQL